MKVIVGLGNPGKRYSKSRHNIGFVAVDRLTEELQAKGHELQGNWRESAKGKLQYFWFEFNGRKVELIKPRTFMNESGSSIVYVHKNHPELKHDDICVIHDDLDLEPGAWKLQFDRSAAGHKGVLDVIEKLGTKEFWRLRLGVGKPEGDGERYVLSPPEEEEKELIEGAIKESIAQVLAWVRGDGK